MISPRILRICLFALAMSPSVTSIPKPIPTVSPKGTYSEYLKSLASQRPHSLGTTRPPASYPAGSYAHALNKGKFSINKVFN